MGSVDKNKQTYLCIGGPLDGHVLAYRGETFKAPVLVDNNAVIARPLPDTLNTPLNDCAYNAYRLVLGHDAGEVGMYIEDGSTTANALTKVLTHYSKTVRKYR